jgi:hypothetical protein
VRAAQEIAEAGSQRSQVFGVQSVVQCPAIAYAS